MNKKHLLRIVCFVKVCFLVVNRWHGILQCLERVHSLVLILCMVKVIQFN